MTIPVGHSSIANTVSVTGTIQADSGECSCDGEVVRVYVKDGDTVAKG